MTPDVVVVGAGAIGSAITYYLAKAGARVLMLDRGAVGAQATQASAGMLIPLSEGSGPGPFTEMAIESVRLFEALNEELLERTGMDIGYRRASLVRVALDELEEHELRTRRAWQDRLGIPVAWLDAASALDVEPNLDPAVRAALFYPGDHQVNALALAQALARAAADLGAVVREGVPVDGLVTEGDRVVGVRTGIDIVRADEVVIASGAWSASWSETLRMPIPVRPIRGQILALRTTGTPLRNVVYAHDGYLIGKPDGLTYVGATEEDVGFDASPTAAGVARLLGVVPRLAPGLTDASFVRAWAGLRPATPDRLPIMGRPPQWQGVSLATGHFRNGILLAPVTGILIADLLRRERPRLSLDAFSPARFLVRAA
ncbi:MAG TPA: glycine oxidase ThiO [Candidatus Dormibacteraeota bacterium]